MYQRTSSQGLGFSIPGWLTSAAQKAATLVTGKPTTVAGATVTLPVAQPPNTSTGPYAGQVLPPAMGGAIDTNTMLLLGGLGLVAFMLLGKKRR